jgi:hypothetical protein
MPDGEMMELFRELHHSGYSFNDGDETFHFDDLCLEEDRGGAQNVTYHIEPIPTAGPDSGDALLVFTNPEDDSSEVSRDVPLNPDGSVTVRISGSQEYNGVYTSAPFQPSASLSSLSVSAIREADAPYPEARGVEYTIAFEGTEEGEEEGEREHTVARALPRRPGPLLRSYQERALRERQDAGSFPPITTTLQNMQLVWDRPEMLAELYAGARQDARVIQEAIEAEDERARESEMIDADNGYGPEEESDEE